MLNKLITVISLAVAFGFYQVSFAAPTTTILLRPQVPSLASPGNPCVTAGTIETLGLFSTSTCGGGGIATSGVPTTGEVAYFDPDGNTLTGTSTFNFKANAIGEGRLLIGGAPNTDPTEAVLSGGVTKFMLVGEHSSLGTNFGAYTGSNTGNPTFFGVRSRGSVANPTQTLNNDVLFNLTGVGFGTGNAMVFSPVASQVAFEQDGDPAAAHVPGRLVFRTANQAGNLGDRLVIRNDGKVGIGTFSPSTTFHVVGDSRFSQTSTFGGKLLIGSQPQLFENTGNNQLTYQRGSGSSTILEIKGPSADAFESTLTVYNSLGGSSAEFMDIFTERYANDHAAGIAVAASGTGQIIPFTLRQWRSASGTIADVGKYWLTATPNGTVGINIDTSTPTGDNSALYVVASSSRGTQQTNIARFESTPGITRMIFTGAGNLGIGTSTPAELLHLYKPTAGFTTMRFDSAATQGYFFSFDGDNSVNMGSNSNSQVNFKVNNSTRASLDTSGNFNVPARVAAGTSTAPVNTLEVVGNVRFQSSSTVITPAIGGEALLAGACASATSSIDTTVTSSTAAFVTTPQNDPGDAVMWKTTLLSPGLIITKACAVIAVTPVQTPYVVKIIK